MSKDNVVSYNTFWISWHEAMSELTDEQYGRLSRALNDYCFFGKLPELSGIEKIIFTMAVPNINSSTESKISGQKGGNAGKGGAPIGNSNAKKNNPETTETIPSYCNNQYPPFEKNNGNGKEKGNSGCFSFSENPQDQKPPDSLPDKPAETKEDAMSVFKKACDLWNERKLPPECRNIIIPPAHYDCLPTFQNYSWLEIENSIKNYHWHKTGKCGEGWSRAPPYGSIYGFLKTGVARYFDDDSLEAQFKECEANNGSRK